MLYCLCFLLIPLGKLFLICMLLLHFWLGIMWYHAFSVSFSFAVFNGSLYSNWVMNQPSFLDKNICNFEGYFTWMTTAKKNNDRWLWKSLQCLAKDPRDVICKWENWRIALSSSSSWGGNWQQWIQHLLPNKWTFKRNHMMLAVSGEEYYQKIFHLHDFLFVL